MYRDDVAENIMNERRGEIDHNPSMDCTSCGDSFNWRDYWSDRIDSPEDEFVCDQCRGERERLRRREENNQQITEFA